MVIIAYDVTNELSFSSCVRWVDRIRHIKPAITRPGNFESFWEIPLLLQRFFLPLSAVLLANKTDLSSRRVVTPKMGEDFAANNNLTYFECSAKESENVDAPFVHLAKEYHALYKDKIEQAKELVSLWCDLKNAQFCASRFWGRNWTKLLRTYEDWLKLVYCTRFNSLLWNKSNQLTRLLA